MPLHQNALTTRISRSCDRCKAQKVRCIGSSPFFPFNVINSLILTSVPPASSVCENCAVRTNETVTIYDVYDILLMFPAETQQILPFRSHKASFETLHTSS